MMEFSMEQGLQWFEPGTFIVVSNSRAGENGLECQINSIMMEKGRAEEQRQRQLGGVWQLQQLWYGGAALSPRW